MFDILVCTYITFDPDEQYRKDMYLAFVNNALQMKSMVISSCYPCQHGHVSHSVFFRVSAMHSTS